MQFAPTSDSTFRQSRQLLLALAGLGFLCLPNASALQGESAGVVPAPSAPPALAEPGEDGPRLRAGERLDPSAFGPFVIEGLDAVLERQAKAGPDNGPSPKARNGAQGEWEVPGMRWCQRPHSGQKHLINRWGDTRLGIGFGREVELAGAWLAAQGTYGSWTSGVQAVGYRDGVEVARTEWFEAIGEEPAWFPMELGSIDRVELVARPTVEGAGWYALDDLAFAVHGEAGAIQQQVLDFEDLPFGTRLTSSGYAGLEWERGTGDFSQEVQVVPPPQVPPGKVEPSIEADPGTQSKLGGGGTAPNVAQDFIGPKFGDAGANLVPPDTCGAVGPTHFLSATNANLSAFVKSTGVRVMNVSLSSFWGVGGLGDPRVAYDSQHGRWVAIASNFNNRVYLAYSLTSDPTGTWFKTNVLVAQGTDAGKWPDYPTLGVDASGVYFAAYMVGGANQMSIFAVDKAPLLSGTPTLGTVTAWRLLPWEGAIQPCVTHGSSGGEYLVSRRSSTLLRIRQITGPLTAPTLVETGSVSVPSHSSAPDAPQQGTSATLDTIDYRHMNAVYRNGSVWTAHCINVSGRAGVRWYELDPVAVSAPQIGTISDSVFHYYMPGISVNASDQMVVGFSGSSPSSFVGAYLSGRLPSDPPGEVSAPILYKAGEAPYTQLSSAGVNRWGDYSLTSIDPVGDKDFWTIQEYARIGNTWVTHIARATFDCTVSNYCTSKISSSLCQPWISSQGGSASLSIPTAFQIDTASMEINVSGLSLFSLAGPAGIPFQGGFMCLTSPVHRLQGKSSGGTASCTGSLSYTLADVLAQPSGGSQVVAGSQVWCQTWSRDLADPFQTSLSNGLSFDVCP